MAKDEKTDFVVNTTTTITQTVALKANTADEAVKLAEDGKGKSLAHDKQTRHTARVRGAEGTVGAPRIAGTPAAGTVQARAAAARAAATNKPAQQQQQ